MFTLVIIATCLPPQSPALCPLTAPEEKCVVFLVCLWSTGNSPVLVLVLCDVWIKGSLSIYTFPFLKVKPPEFCKRVSVILLSPPLAIVKASWYLLCFKNDPGEIETCFDHPLF